MPVLSPGPQCLAFEEAANIKQPVVGDGKEYATVPVGEDSNHHSKLDPRFGCSLQTRAVAYPVQGVLELQDPQDSQQA